jgi:CspA family cold shock protein
MSIALEKQFEYRIPKVLLAENTEEVPSLLSGYEAIVAKSDRERKKHLRAFMPTVIRKVRSTVWEPRPLPFVEPVLSLAKERPIGGSGGNLTWERCVQLAVQHTLPKLDSHAQIYQERTYVVPKLAEKWLLSRVQDSSHNLPIWIIGTSGTGKTSLLCHVAQRLVQEENVAVFLYSASQLGEEPIEALLSRAMGQDGNLNSDLKILHAQLPKRDLHWHLVLIIDAVNEHPDYQTGVHQIDNIWALASSYSWFKIVISSRLESFEESRADTNAIDSYVLNGLNDSESLDAYRRYQVEYGLQTPPAELSEQVRQLIRNPLMLKTLAAAYQGREIPANPRVPTIAHQQETKEPSSRHAEDEQAEERLLGTVRSWSSERGYGFITSDDSGEDIFVHVSDLAVEGYPDFLTEGQRVEFAIEESPKGLRATRVTFAPGGETSKPSLRQAEDEQTSEHLLGTVKWWSSEKGYGFITPDEGGNDIFAHYSGIAMEGAQNLTEGQRVKFVIEESSRGPRATRVTFAPGEETSESLLQQIEEEQASQRLLGTVKWWSSTKGYGFITPDASGDDIFVHYSALVTEGFPDLTEGQRVEFAIEENPKGPRAVQVVPLSRV